MGKNKCPCMGCVCYPVCRLNELRTIVPLIKKCSIITNYTVTEDRALRLIKLYKPPYYSMACSSRERRKLVGDNIKTILQYAKLYRKIYNRGEEK